MSIYSAIYPLLKRFLFRMEPERAHHFTLNAFRRALKIPLISRWIRSTFLLQDQRLERKLFGLTFKNPVGLAAGFDKNGEYLKEFAAMGFGFIEIGTVTPEPQDGNPTPRLFRLPEDHALINRMGFNNKGMNVIAENLKDRPRDIILGGNIGKNKITPNDVANRDYLKCFESLYPHVDYFVVNVSSPNTPDLRKLQEKGPLESLLKELKAANKRKALPKPILLKIAPDLSEDQLDDIIEIAANTKLDGIIATNTTTSREGLLTHKQVVDEIGPGGLSGQPVKSRSTEIIKYLRVQDQDIPIIAVGGIFTAQDALEKLAAGANLVQIYTGLVYQGPMLIKEINQSLLT